MGNTTQYPTCGEVVYFSRSLESKPVCRLLHRMCEDRQQTCICTIESCLSGFSRRDGSMGSGPGAVLVDLLLRRRSHVGLS